MWRFQSAMLKRTYILTGLLAAILVGLPTVNLLASPCPAESATECCGVNAGQEPRSACCEKTSDARVFAGKAGTFKVGLKSSGACRCTSFPVQSALPARGPDRQSARTPGTFNLPPALTHAFIPGNRAEDRMAHSPGADLSSRLLHCVFLC